MESSDSLLEELRERIRNAVDTAREISVDGRILGRITRVKPVEVAEDKRLVLIEIPFRDYIEYTASGETVVGLGSILGIVNPISKRIVLGEVVGYRREDLLSAMNIPLTTPLEDPSTLQTPLVLSVHLLAEAEIGANGLGEPQPPITPLEPGSPVIVPRPEVVKKLLGIPREGVLLGYLVAGNSVRRDVDVRLPLQALYHHVLVIGTTGSGKTVFLKNLALSVNHEYHDEKPLVVAFDLQGDYLALVIGNNELEPNEKVYEPLDKLTVIVPVTKRFFAEVSKGLAEKLDVGEAVEELGRRIALEYVSKTYRGELEVVEVSPLPNVVKEGDKELYVLELVDVELEDKASGRRITLTIVPWSLRYVEVRDSIVNFMPMFSDQARIFLPRILEKRRYETLESLIVNIENIRYVADKEFNLHSSTIANIVRGLIALRDTELFDNYIQVGEAKGMGIYTTRPTIWVKEPDYEWLLQKHANTMIVDLRWPAMYSSSPYTETIIVYRILEKIFEWKDKKLRKGEELRPTIILVDEAHNYFPQTTRETFSKDIVEATINKMTRLGRIRRIGVVFATHQPQDLNNLVIQLANTKIAFRSDKKSLEAIGLSEHHETLQNTPSGYAVVSTYTIRTQTLTIQTPPPQTKHQKP